MHLQNNAHYALAVKMGSVRYCSFSTNMYVNK